MNKAPKAPEPPIEGRPESRHMWDGPKDKDWDSFVMGVLVSWAVLGIFIMFSNIALAILRG